MKEVFILISEVGFPIAITLVSGFFIFLTIKYLLDSVIGQINGLYPYPGAFFIFNGERYKILKAEIGSGAGKVGEVVSNNLEVACGNNQTIKILEIQRQGKNPQKI